MAALWFFIGALSAVATLFVLLPWLRVIPGLGSLPKIAWPVSAAAAALLTAAVGLYVWLGRPEVAANAGPESIAPHAQLGAAGTGGPPSNAGVSSMGSAIASLQARLAKGGGSADDWELLAKAYEFVGQPGAAAQARAHQLPDASAANLSAAGAAAAAIAPGAAPSQPSASSVVPQLKPESLKLLSQADAARRHKHLKEALSIYGKLAAANQLNADGWADYADTAASAQSNRLAGEPEQFIRRALALDPHQPKALWLEASADEEAGRLAQAIATWRQLQVVLPPDSPDAKIIAANLQQDQKLIAGASAAPAPVPQGAPLGDNSANGVGSAILRGQVSLSPALSSRLSGRETLFIVAKSVDSPGPPVAVLRGSATAWPVSFALDDSQAMIPGRNLSSVARVTVEARISRSGQALPMSGDLAGSSTVIDAKAPQPLAIVIDHIVP